MLNLLLPGSLTVVCLYVCVFVCLFVYSQEEFCFPVECLSLTVEEVMHIRQVLVKAELEKFQQYKEIYNAMKKGKVTSSFLTHGACITPYSI